MPQYTTEAIVLRTYPLGESDRIVVFLTRDRGKKRGVARGARRSRRRFGAALEPLTWARVAYVEKENRELVSLDYAEPLRSPLSAAGDETLGYASYFAELLDEWAPNDHPNDRLFRLGSATVRALADGAPVTALARYFEYWLLRLEGVYPAMAACAGCGQPLEAGGASLAPGADALLCLVCAPHGETDLSPSALTFLKQAGPLPPEALASVRLPEGAARELERLHRALLARHLDRESRAMRVVREMAAALAVASRATAADADPPEAP